MEPTVAVQVRAVSKWFGAATALDRVDLALEAGSVHGLLGPNGAGKTTLLAMLLGLARPDEGDVRLFGRTRAQAGPAWLDGVGGFVETPRFYPYLTGRRNLLLLADLDGGDASGLVDDALAAVGLGGAGGLAGAGGRGGTDGLGDAGGTKVRGYSLGMRQRLGLAAALIRRPRLLILDEPGNGLDPAGVRDLRRALRRLAADGVAVLLSSHDMAQAELLCDRVSVLNRGRVVFDGSLGEMRAAAPRPVWRLSTSDDAGALALASGLRNPQVHEDDGGGLRVVAERAWLDDYVIRLGAARIAVRALWQRTGPLEALFFALTEDVLK